MPPTPKRGKRRLTDAQRAAAAKGRSEAVRTVTAQLTARNGVPAIDEADLLQKISEAKAQRLDAAKDAK